jgi:anti-sigma B factor antagonist
MITARYVGGVAVLDVQGGLEGGVGAPGLRPAIRQAIERGSDTIVVNLEKIGGIDSAGVSQLASAHMTAVNSGGRLRLCGLSHKLQEVFDVTRLSTVFDIYPTEADAIAGTK